MFVGRNISTRKATAWKKKALLHCNKWVLDK